MGDKRPAAAATAVAKRSLLIAGHSTSVSLEDAFWRRLRVVAEQRGTSVAALVAAIDVGRAGVNLSSAIRVFLLEEALVETAASHGAKVVAAV